MTHTLKFSKISKLPGLLLVVFCSLPVFAASKSSSKNELSLNKQVGQMFAFGFQGTRFTKKLKSHLSKYPPGALIFFKRNFKSTDQVSRLIDAAQKTSMSSSGMPLFTMIDQEGGVVSRLPLNPPPASALAVGQTGEPQVAFDMAQLTGQALAKLGFNFNLAPVADLSDPERQNFVGNRVFGAHPKEVSLFVQSYSKGLLSSGVLPTLKHFPGHGNVVTDSHRALPTKNITLDELLSNDAVPFASYAKSQLPGAIMTAHVAFPQIDPSGRPATFSKVLLTDLLRDKMKFQGLIITDDLEMYGADGIGDIGERAVEAILAGADLLMIAWSQDRQSKAIKAVVRAVESGRISRQRIQQSLQRIATYKKQFAESKATSRSMAKIFKDLSSYTHKVARLNFENSLSEYPHVFAQTADFDKIVVYSAYNSFYQQFKNRVHKPTKMIRLIPKRPVNFQRTLAKATTSLGVYYLTGSGTARLLESMPEKLRRRMVVINTAYPGIIRNPKDYLAVFNIRTKNHLVGSRVAHVVGQARRKPSSRSKKN